MRDPLSAMAGYCADVDSGARPACAELRNAVKRHYRDLKAAESTDFPFYFDCSEIYNIDEFSMLCAHQKGEMAGTPFIPEPWQLFILGSVYCWKYKTTGMRRFRTVYVIVPRKSGKSTLMGVVGLYGMTSDGEQGAEIYSAATKRQQAREIFDVAKSMATKSPALKNRVNAYQLNLSVKGSMSKFEPLGRDSDTMDGSNPHYALIDEYHAHKDDGIRHVLVSGMGARRQPLLWIITTAGFNLHGPCKKMHDTCSDILSPDKPTENDSIFAYISTIDEGDDIHDPHTWKKANPNYGVSVYEESMRLASDNARMMPSEENNFKTKNLNIWVGQAEGWLSTEKWRLGDDVPKPLKGRSVFVGCDLSTTTDLCSLVGISEDEDGVLDVFCRFWAPKERAKQRQHRDGVPYEAWAAEGILTLHDGDAVDYDRLRIEIREQMQEWGASQIGIDPWNATHLAQQLMEDGIDMVQIIQGFRSLSGPTKELERRVVMGRIRHGGNPVLDWCAGNVVLEYDAAGNIKPSKKDPVKRIDGVAALVNALARLIIDDLPTVSIYETQGIRSL